MRQIIFVFISILLLSFPTEISAQANSSILTGQIVDEFGTPLYGANIIAIDLNQGTSANSNGDYILKGNFEGTHKIEYSYVGFKSITKTIIFKKGETQTLNIILKEDPSALDEISLNLKVKFV